MEIRYLCDRIACKNCNPMCSHTKDIGHAINFKVFDVGSNFYLEKPPEKEYLKEEIYDLAKDVRTLKERFNDLTKVVNVVLSWIKSIKKTNGEG